MNYRNCILFASLFLALQAFAAKVPMEYSNKIYEENIKTVQVFQAESVNEVQPMFPLGQKNQLTLSFDELKETNDFYQYTLIHCTYDWKPSDIDINQYLTGNRFDNVSDYVNSRNTFTRYINYRATFPNDNLQPKISGNYLLKVYRNFDEEDIILTWRIYILDPKVTIEANIHPATLPDARFTSHEIDFETMLDKVQVIFPDKDLKVALNQNMVIPFTRYDLQPRFVLGAKVDYNYEKENVFPAGNEFRSFDFRSLRFMSQNVGYKKIIDNQYFLSLFPVEPRFQVRYQTITDMNGRMIIQNKDGIEPRYDADYAQVEFVYSAPKINIDGDYYLIGELTQWDIQDKYKLTYNEEAQAYTVRATLKQGYYEYQYVFVSKDDKGNQLVEYVLTEGDKAETEDNYFIYFYVRNQFLSYHELVGFQKVNSRSDNKD